MVIAISRLPYLSDRRFCLKAGMAELHVNHGSFQFSILR